MSDHSNNIFDDDDALDFIIYKSLEKQNREQSGNNKRGQGGCLGFVFLLVIPVSLLMFVL